MRRKERFVDDIVGEVGPTPPCLRPPVVSLVGGVGGGRVVGRGPVVVEGGRVLVSWVGERVVVVGH